jgi:hypothetical protein
MKEKLFEVRDFPYFKSHSLLPHFNLPFSVSSYLCAEDLVVGQGVDGRDVPLEGQNDENRCRLLSESPSQQSLRNTFRLNSRFIYRSGVPNFFVL